MKARIPLMIQDPRTSTLAGIRATEGFDPVHEDFFLDGPVTKRVAVLDFSPTTGELLKGAYFRPPPPGRKRGWYSYTRTGPKNDVYKAKEKQLYSPVFMQTSVFATVLKTMYLFEEEKEGTEEEVLGRHVNWAFGAPQLLIIPRAGEQANAFYHRDSHSLQFFYFRSPKDRRKIIYTCLSRDIVAHETGHAIVDGLAPDLLDACTPQSLAIHESIADLTALLMSFASHTLAPKVLEKTKGSLDVSSTAFSCIAEEFGKELYPEREGLRELRNTKNLNPMDKKNFVRDDHPHDLSEVLSGALYRTMINIHEQLKPEIAKKPRYAEREDPEFSASGEALRVGAKRLRRMIFRALDVLPSGEIGFPDYGRAIIAVDQIAYPADDNMRNLICKEFVLRHIINDEKALRVQTNFEDDALKDIELADLYSSDWVAYDFANKNKELFCIPVRGKPIPFHVRPRLSVKKKYDDKHPAGKIGHECIFKIAWQHEEPNPIGSGYPQKRVITVGTTLVIDWKTRKILARLTSSPPTKYRLKCQKLDSQQRKLARHEYKQQQAARDKFLRRLADEGILKIGKHAIDPTGQPRKSVVMAEVSGDTMRIRHTANMLHIVGRGADL
ncbi:MAG: hypothetical protein JSW14_00110 [Candidatus Bathyarchaeum sp.]|nr:MAG: hypothetical protein JSW14_00110 [Candidatus Bathyarchaeum sp.]